MSTKQMIGKAILRDIPRSGVIAFGSGTTVDVIVSEIGKSGEFDNVQFVSGSSSTSIALKNHGLREVKEQAIIDLCIDGADQIVNYDPHYILKGKGGALFREKVLWKLSKRIIVGITSDKFVQHLSMPIPVEVDPFAIDYVTGAIQKNYSQSQIIRRMKKKNELFVSDNGNMILDCLGLLSENPQRSRAVEIEQWLKSLTGVVETGLFTDMDSKPTKAYIHANHKIESIDFEL